MPTQLNTFGVVADAVCRLDRPSERKLNYPLSEIRYFKDDEIERLMILIKANKICSCGSKFLPNSVAITKSHLMTDKHQFHLITHPSERKLINSNTVPSP